MDNNDKPNAGDGDEQRPHDIFDDTESESEKEQEEEVVDGEQETEEEEKEEDEEEEDSNGSEEGAVKEIEIEAWKDVIQQTLHEFVPECTLEEMLEDDKYPEFQVQLRNTVYNWLDKCRALKSSTPMEKIAKDIAALLDAKNLDFDAWEARMAAWERRKHFMHQYLIENIELLS